MYGAFDVVLYFVIIQLFWLLINLLLILSYLICFGGSLTLGYFVSNEYLSCRLGCRWRCSCGDSQLENVLMFRTI